MPLLLLSLAKSDYTRQVVQVIQWQIVAHCKTWTMGLLGARDSHARCAACTCSQATRQVVSIQSDMYSEGVMHGCAGVNTRHGWGDGWHSLHPECETAC